MCHMSGNKLLTFTENHGHNRADVSRYLGGELLCGINQDYLELYSMYEIPISMTTTGTILFCYHIRKVNLTWVVYIWYIICINNHYNI